MVGESANLVGTFDRENSYHEDWRDAILRRLQPCDTEQANC